MKQFAFVFCAGMTALLLFSGCSGINELNSALGEAAGADEITAPKLNIVKNKTTKSEIFQSIGAPGLVFRNEINGETWVYQRVAVRQTDVGFQARGNFSALFPYQRIRSPAAVELPGSVPPPKSARAVPPTRRRG